MSKRRSQSQIILNFFTLASIIIISVTLTLYVKYIVPNQKEKAQETPKKIIEKLTCQSDSFTRVKVFNEKLLIDSEKALDSGFYKLSGGYIEKEEVLKSFISKEELDKYFYEAIKIEPKKEIKKYLSINYELVEKAHKKSTCKFCEANIIASFRAGHKELFRMETDILLLNKTEIKSRIECIVKVYKNHAR